MGVLIGDIVKQSLGARWWAVLFFQAEDGTRGVEWSRGLGDVYKRLADYPGF